MRRKVGVWKEKKVGGLGELRGTGREPWVTVSTVSPFSRCAEILRNPID